MPSGAKARLKAVRFHKPIYETGISLMEELADCLRARGKHELKLTGPFNGAERRAAWTGQAPSPYGHLSQLCATSIAEEFTFRQNFIRLGDLFRSRLRQHEPEYFLRHRRVPHGSEGLAVQRGRPVLA